ncbi:hypothetical protein C8F04DRAFT_1347966 [Mycena alexandri]|uniref:Uncharacterized protein n=1 Tax=Mycena alexandri TaxID=1745969 RepID=A0AAD6WK32_9AGAR|nr:hypothetical protein C8F04DRAFT_1347966 [Mycena alexandri]
MAFDNIPIVPPRLESGSDGSPKERRKSEPPTGEVVKDIDEWIISHEKYLGDGERLGDDWHFGLVTLADSDAVFPTSMKTNASRTIVRPTNLPGYQILGSTRASQIEIQPSTADFKRTFHRLSDGLLKGLDWSNVFIAGGIILGTLLAADTQPDIQNQWAASDIDVYLYGLGPEAANAKLDHLFKTFRANLPEGTPTLVVRNSKTVTFYSRYPLRRVQVVLELVRLPRVVLLNFDLDVCRSVRHGVGRHPVVYASPSRSRAPNVFTMNLIQKHYLLERRATQEQRVFKYANRVGFDLAMGFESFIASLEDSKTTLRRISRDEKLFELDMDQIGEASRVWTQRVLKFRNSSTFGHRDLYNKHQLSAGPQGRSCLSGFSLFMRHMALWDSEQNGDLIIDQNNWASTDYGDASESVIFSTRNPDIEVNSNSAICWPIISLPLLRRYPEAAKRLTYGTTVTDVLEPTRDILLLLLLRADFAAFANRLVGHAQAAAGLNVLSILTPAVESHEHLLDAKSGAEGIFLWRIGREIMWQQLDRRIDEVFEALYVFYRYSDRTMSDWQQTRLLTQLSKRAIRAAIEDEFDAFARWVGRRQIFSIDDMDAENSDEEHEEED